MPLDGKEIYVRPAQSESKEKGTIIKLYVFYLKDIITINSIISILIDIIDNQFNS